MKEGWKEKNLESLCEIFADGDWIESKDQSDSGIRLIQTGNIGFGYFKDKEEKSRFISNSTFNRLKCTEIFPGDILVSRLPDPVGKSCIIPETNIPMITGVDCTIIRLKGCIKPDYLRYYQMSDKYLNDILVNVSGATRQRISRKKLGTILIPFPPLPEQQRIVSILDEAFAAIDKAKANAEKNLKNAKELFESYLQGVFENKGDGWEEKKLGDLCETGAGGTPLKSHKDYYQNGNIPWLRSGEVNKRDIEFCELFITEKGLKNSSAKLFPENTVLIAMYGATAGQVGILRFKCSTNQAVCGILPNDKILPEFVYYKFLAGKEVLVAQAVGGAQPNISQIKIKNTLVPFISLENQRIIVDKLDALSAETKRLESIYQQKLIDLEELKKTILQKAFNGELNTADICV